MRRNPSMRPPPLDLGVRLQLETDIGHAPGPFECLERLAWKTGRPLFAALARRVMQLNLWTQVTGGDFEGGLTEAVADPWLDRRETFDWRGIAYNNELSIDLALQILDAAEGVPPTG